MRKVIVTMVFLLCVALGIASVGCAALYEYVTPTTVNKQGIAYVEKAGVVEPGSLDGYESLYKAKQLKEALPKAHRKNMHELQQMVDDENLEWALLTDTISADVDVGESRGKALFAPGGLLTTLGAAFGMGGAGTVIGKLFMSKPGDVSGSQMEEAVAAVKGKVTEKDRQFIQVVKGVQTFMTAHQTVEADGAKKDDAIATALKAALSSATDDDTKIAVRVAKT